ncbi:hypothetical protein H9P43_005371 [Blastocladiella emersonii ATCC 22665]|nr:hypothetical protein H9P43_005371 [Blastocladiella emersonii ATCC 22665]
MLASTLLRTSTRRAVALGRASVPFSTASSTARPASTKALRWSLVATAFAAGVAAATVGGAGADVHNETAATAPAPKPFDVTGLPEDKRDTPGLFVWGANVAGLVDPKLKLTDPATVLPSSASDPATAAPAVKYPRRNRVFDGMRFRDVQFGTTSAVAIDEHGDVYQWGTGFCGTDAKRMPAAPTKTIIGHDIVRVALSPTHLFAVSRAGAVHAVPLSAADQAAKSGVHPVADAASLAKPASKGWWPFTSGTPAQSDLAAFPTLALPAGDAKAVDVAAGADHVVVLTEARNVYTAALTARGVHCGAIGRDASPSESAALHKAVPEPETSGASAGTLWAEVVPAVVQPVAVDEIALRKVPIEAPVAQIAAGRAHTIVRTADGRALAFGSNSFGQLGLGDWSRQNQITPRPTELIAPRRHAKVIHVAAAGDVTALVTHHTAFTPATGAVVPSRAAPPADTYEVYTCGNGQFGSIGHGQFVHVQPSLTRVRALSSLHEYSDAEQKLVPLVPRDLVLAPVHAACTLAPAHGGDATGDAGQRTVYMWGSGADFATGTGRRSHLATPTPASPLPWRYGFRAAGGAAPGNKATVTGPENGDGIEQMVVLPQQAVAVGPGVSCIYTKA